MENGFSEKYLASLGYHTDWPLNQNAVLPAVLSCFEIAHIMTHDGSDPWFGGSDNDDQNFENQQIVKQVALALAHACRRGLIKSKLPFAEHSSKCGGGYVGFLIHFDDARRYFAALDLFPAEGSVLATWLRRGEASDKKKRSIAVQDRADFQQLCAEQWVRNPTQRITGEGSVVEAVGVAYSRQYRKETLGRWARAVAPESVRNRNGRPRKSDDSKK